MPKVKTFQETGKRKTAIARAKIGHGKGRVRVNNVPIELIQSEYARIVMMEPLILAGDSVRKSVDIDVSVMGGGFMGQAQAVRMAIARGLVEWTDSSELRSLYREHDRSMLSGDPRVKEAKKFGGRGARRRHQKSYR